MGDQQDWIPTIFYRRYILRVIAKSRPHAHTRKLTALLRVYTQETLAYKASVITWSLTDVIMMVTMPFVMLAAARNGAIQGFSGSDFVLYYLVMLGVSSLVASHFMWEIATEIREGIFSTHIIRPVGYLQFTLMRNLAWRAVRTAVIIPWILLFLFVFAGHLEGATVVFSWQFVVVLVLGHLLSVFFVCALGMITLYTQEANSIFELYYLPAMFLSGQIFPIALFPDWVRSLALIFPFYYTVGAPTELLIGRIATNDAGGIIAIQLVWIAVSIGLFKWFWKHGLKHYTGVGM